MRILNVMGDAYYPQMTGGTQACLHELMISLRDIDHTPLLVAGLWGGKLEWRSRLEMRLSGRPWVRHRWHDYHLYRKWHAWEHVDEFMQLLQPDLVLVQGTAKAVRIADAYSRHGIPVSMYLHEVDFTRLGGDPRTLSGVKFIANSDFTKGRVKEIYGLDSYVLPPIFFDAERYTVTSSRENVTFINPVPMKGVELAYEIAALCPEIPFHFVQSWTLSDAELAAIAERLKLLPNVRFSRSVYDMRQIYGKAKIMLVPSQVDEAWGRVVSKSQCSGIPSLYSRRGGLPEAAGEGGICLEHDAPAKEWAEALRSLWTNEAVYAEKSEAALQNGNRITGERNLRLRKLIDFAAGPETAMRHALPLSA